MSPSGSMRPPPTPRPPQGLSLIELLVVLLILALMAVLGTSALAVLLRSQQQSQEAARALARLQIGLAQWQRDLTLLERNPYLNALQWDGQVLRLLRRSASGDALQVVAWSVQAGQWRRWQSAPVQERDALMAAWQQALDRDPGDRPTADKAQSWSVAVLPLQDWALAFHDQGQWIGAVPSDRLRELPAALRLRLQGLTALGNLQVDQLVQARP